MTPHAPQPSKSHFSLPRCQDEREEQGRLGVTGSERVGVGEFGDWGDGAVTVLFCLPHKPARASAAPSWAFRLWNCSQNDRLVAPGWGGGWGGVKGEPQARGSWRVKNSNSRVSVSKCGGGELEAGQAAGRVCPQLRAVFPLGPRSESRWS